MRGAENSTKNATIRVSELPKMAHQCGKTISRLAISGAVCRAPCIADAMQMS